MKKFKWILLIWLSWLAIVLGAICFFMVLLAAICLMVGIDKNMIELTISDKLFLFSCAAFFFWASERLTFGGKEILEKAQMALRSM